MTVPKISHGSTFTGIGGFDLAAEWMGWDNVFHCELEEYKRKRLNINFPNSISHGKIEETDFTQYRGIDVLTGGFPCQDASIAKQDGQGQQGLQGARTGLVWEMFRAIEESQPKVIVAENVSNFLKVNNGHDMLTVLRELSRMGYNAEWRTLYASDVGAPHKRKRLYLVAYANSIRMQPGFTFFSYVAKESKPSTWRAFGTPVQIVRGGAWETEPPVLCVDDGVSLKLVRQSLHGYGNAVVPQIPLGIFQAINEVLTN